MTEAIRFDLIPLLSPNVETHILQCLSAEVSAYAENVTGNKCLLCPFRTFDRLSRLKNHLKSHCEKNWFLADRRSCQRSVVKAYYDYIHASKPIAPVKLQCNHLLQKSASLIADWNATSSMSTLKSLQKLNRPILVRVLTHTGPQLWLKELTTACIRHSRELYYTTQFADLYLSLLLTNEARVTKCLDALHFHFSTTSITPGLLPSSTVFWNDISTAITTHEQFTTKIKDLKHKAATAGEFEVISHDETFKSLFCLLGQTKMSQKEGEFHALHTFRGFTGCTIGLSAQRTTSQQCFMNAVNETFDTDLKAKVKFLFSDCPSRIYKAARLSFPALLALGEDPLHLPFRLEYCWGGKMTKASVRVRELHTKFRIPTTNTERFWQPDDGIQLSSVWPQSPAPDSRTPAEWKTFCALPFIGETAYISYVAELAKITADYGYCMQRKNSDGIIALSVLQNASTRQHFEALQNSSRLMALLGVIGFRLGTGTTRNEQLHREIKSWTRNIYTSHAGRLQSGFRIFLFAKLLTHSSAAYSPTLTQKSQSRLLSIIAGQIRQTRFFSTNLETSVNLPQTRKTLHAPVLPINNVSRETRFNKRKSQDLMWKKSDIRPSKRSPSQTNIFRRPRTSSRQHVFQKGTDTNIETKHDEN